jgi:hypothetical protein
MVRLLSTDLLTVRIDLRQDADDLASRVPGN